MTGSGGSTGNWHLQSEVTQYPFPTEAAAVRFAQNHKAQHLGVTIRYPDGRRWSGKEWL